MSTEDVYQDAEIDGLSKRSWFGSWARGVVVGLVVFAIGAVVLSLSTPLPEHLPGVGKVEIVQNGEAAATRQPQVSDDPATKEPEVDAPANGSDQPEDGAQTAATDQDQVTAPGAPAQPVASAGDDASAPTTPSQSDQPQADSAQPATPSQDVAPSGDGTVQQGQVAATDGADDTETPATPAAPETPSAPEAVETPETTSEDQQVAAVDPEQQQPELPPVPEINLPGPALDVNARPFSPPDGATLLAVVLQDADSGAISADALQLMTMPLTLAVGPGPESRVFAEKARAAGHEVLAQIPMAEGEQATDGTLSPGQSAEELTLQANRLMAELDLAIGATAPYQAPLLRDRDGMAAIMDPLGPHGFVWIDPRLGIGSAAKGIAALQDITWSAGDRFIDPGASEAQVYQNLESSAALARRQGSSIVFLTASQDALKALVRWGLNRGGRQVWFAPVSAVIKHRQAN